MLNSKLPSILTSIYMYSLYSLTFHISLITLFLTCFLQVLYRLRFWEFTCWTASGGLCSCSSYMQPRGMLRSTFSLLGQTTCEFSKFMLIVISITSFMVDNLFIIPYHLFFTRWWYGFPCEFPHVNSFFLFFFT